MIRAVLDANILVVGFTSLRSSSSVVAQVVLRWTLGTFDVVISRYVLDELRVAFSNLYFRSRMSDDEVTGSIELLVRRAVTVELTGDFSGVAAHHHDDPVLETAVAGNAGYLVTGDRELLALGAYQGVAILTPREFLSVLDREAAMVGPE